MNMVEIILFVLGTLVLAIVSRRSLLQLRSHGFYRFLAWELLLGLLLLNVRSWFHNPLSWHQLISWTLLSTSLLLVIPAIKLLRRLGLQDPARSDPALLDIEKTSQLVTNGLYRYIRHPMYSSLLFLGWGIFFKSPSYLDGGLTLLCTFFLITTARIEECEDIVYFGEKYVQYMKRTKMFIPFILTLNIALSILVFESGRLVLAVQEYWK